MELTKNQKIVGVSLAGVVAWLLLRKKVKLQSQRTETPSGPTQVVVPVATAAGTGAIANVLGNILPTAHAELVSKALGQVPIVVQGNKVAPTRISTVADIQHALNFLKICGNIPLRDSGVLDPQTVACLKAFQGIVQIPITGMDDPTTKMALESAITKAGISINAPAILSHPDVVTPPHVNPIIQTERDLQRGLNLLGASPKLKEDGKLGPITTAAIKAFQVVHGLVADGLAGPQTKAALATAMSGAAVSPTAPALVSTAIPAHGEFGYIAPPRPRSPYEHRPAPPILNPAMPDWNDPQAGQFFAGDFGMAGRGMVRGGGFRPMRPILRNRAWGLGLPYDEYTEVVEVEDDDGNPVEISGEQLEAGAHYEASRAFEEARLRGDRRFEHPSIGPGAPPLPGENAYRAREEHFSPELHRGERRGWGERFRDWFGFGHRHSIDENPYIPPPATPPVVNWDPFAINVAPAVERWHPNDLRRHEELEHRGFRPEAPIVTGRPASPIVDHPTPPGPPVPRAPAPPPPPPHLLKDL